MRLALFLACGLSVLFAGLLVVQLLQPGSGETDQADATGVVPAPRVRAAVATQAEMPSSPLLHGDDWVATILARPLFTRDRRPAGATTAVASGDAAGTLPRLTGIAISPDQRRAIFAGAEGGKPIVVQEGGTIAGFLVQTIGPDGVTVQGPDGDRVVALAFDPTPPAPRADADQPPQATMPTPPPYGLPYPQGQGPPNFGQGRQPPPPQFDQNGPTGFRPQFNRPRADLGGPESSGEPGLARLSRSS